jgi:uncharacterized membrane protein YadS
MKEDKVEYFIEETNRRLEAIEAKLDRLISFRVMLLGASMTISAFVSVGLTLLELWLLHK